MNLRARAEKDLGLSLENPNHWGQPVELTAPDGTEYKISNNSPDPQNPLPLYGQVLKTTGRINPEDGEILTVDISAVTLRFSGLFRVPKPEENWFIRFPTESTVGAALKSFVLSGDRPPEIDSSLGIITFYPTKAEQST